jgi:hypothetical protein
MLDAGHVVSESDRASLWNRLFQDPAAPRYLPGRLRRRYLLLPTA